jgi:nicotinate-nucleotide adenylyltransferase
MRAPLDTADSLRGAASSALDLAPPSLRACVLAPLDSRPSQPHAHFERGSEPHSPRERIGILGGTFNPPHAGHVELARCALAQLKLDRVLLVPALTPPHKAVSWDPGGEHRAQMCRLAGDGEPRIEVCTAELERPGPSFTVDTLQSIHANRPDAQLTLILGADVAVTLGAWREPREIVRLARIAVAERPGVSRERVRDALDALGARDRLDFLEMTPHDLSSSQVRRALACGEPIDALVGGPVAAYIDQHELYGRRPAAHASGGRA